jgi:hypothetical protein
MEGAVTSIGVTVVSVINSHKSLAAAHVTYAHEHIIRMEFHGTEYQLPYKLMHILSIILAMSVRLHVRRQYNHVTALS